MTGVTCKRYVRAQCLLLVVLFFVVSHCRWWTPFRQHGCVRRLCLRLHYVFNIQVRNHDFRSREFSILHFSDNTWHCHRNYRIHPCEVSDPLAPPAWSWQWCAAFPLDSSRSVELAGFAVPFSSVLSKIIQPSPISNMWPRNHLYLCRMRIGTTCTHATAGHWFGRLSSCLLTSTSSVLFSPIAHTRTRRDILLHKNWLAENRDPELATLDESRRAVGMLNPMSDKMKVRTGGRRDNTHLWPWLVVKKFAEGKTSYELSWKVKVIIKKIQ